MIWILHPVRRMISFTLLPLNPIRVPTLFAGHMMIASADCSVREAAAAAGKVKCASE